jgi:hypothetical protein
VFITQSVASDVRCLISSLYSRRKIIMISNNLLLFSVVFKCIAMVIGVFGNVTVIIYAIFVSKEKTATSYLVGNLAVADLLVCLTFHPIWIIEFIQNILNIDGHQILFCKLGRSTIWAFVLASTLTLVAITVDRYLYIVKPLNYPMIVTRRRVFFNYFCNLVNCLLSTHCIAILLHR